MRSDDEDRDALRKAFREAVNMTPAEIERWLGTEESKDAGWHREGEDETIGHQSGRRIVKILRKRKAELGEEDYAHMRKVVGYVHRHCAQGPSHDVETSRWRYSLMNWGHDPLKDGAS
jgi:hypothetical protein